MNRFRILSFAVFAGFAALTAGTLLLAAAPAQPAPKKQLYTCPMHPMVVQDHPGRCPICGMNLVPVKPGAATQQSTSTCPVQGGCCGGAN